jgi:O-antigen ligase
MTVPTTESKGEVNTSPEALEDAYRIRIKATWQRLRAEPWYFWFFCGYIMFEYVRPQVIYPILNFLPWGMLTLLGAFALRALANEPKEIRSPITLPFLAFFIWAFITALLSYFPAASWQRYEALINWPMVLVLFIWIVNTRFRFYIVLLLFLLCSYKMAQHAGLGWIKRGFAFSRWGAAGASGFFQNAADLGVQLVIFIPLAAVFYHSLKRYWNKWWRYFFLSFPVLGVAAAISTGQRNTMVALAALGVGVILLFKHRIRNLVLVALAAGAVWLAMPDEFKARFETAGQDTTSLSRVRYWERGLDIWQNHSLHGIGYENWLTYFRVYYPDVSALKWKSAEVAHSVPISVLAELGTPGYFIYYWLVATIFFANLRSAKMLHHLDPPLWRLTPIALNLGLIGFLAASFFISIQYYPFLFFQAGFSAALYRLGLKEQALLGNPRGAMKRTRAGYVPANAVRAS